MTRAFAIAVVATTSFALGAPPVAAQAPAQIHDNQYPDVDIAYGSSLYAARCVTCHGAQGDAIGGVNLRSGKFRNAVTDNELARFIRAGSQAAGMPPFALDNSEMAGIIAYLRNMNTFDTATVKARRRRARPRHLRGQGQPASRVTASAALARGWPRISVTSGRSAAPDRCSARSSIRPVR